MRKRDSKITDALKPFACQGAAAPYRVFVGRHHEESIRVNPANCKSGLAASRQTMLVHEVEALASVVRDDKVHYAARWRCGNGTSDAVIIKDADEHGGLCVRCIGAKDRGPAVYRFFDGSRRLLYVGSTADVFQRFQVHAKAATWWGDVVERRIQRFDDITAARSAEATAIRTEHPAYNKRLRRDSGGAA